jgi:hypothetical protein
MADLKPCPFCGFDQPHTDPHEESRWSVRCDNCCVNTPDFSSAEEAARFWNGRTKLDLGEGESVSVRVSRGMLEGLRHLVEWAEQADKGNIALSKLILERVDARVLSDDDLDTLLNLCGLARTVAEAVRWQKRQAERVEFLSTSRNASFADRDEACAELAELRQRCIETIAESGRQRDEACAEVAKLRRDLAAFQAQDDRLAGLLAGEPEEHEPAPLVARVASYCARLAAEIDRLRGIPDGENHDECWLTPLHDRVPFSSACGPHLVEQACRRWDEDRARAAAHSAKVAEELAAMTGVRSELVEVLRDLVDWAHSNGHPSSAVFHARDLIERLQ